MNSMLLLQLGVHTVHIGGSSGDKASRLHQLMLSAMVFGHHRNADRQHIYFPNIVKRVSLQSRLSGLVFLTRGAG